MENDYSYRGIERDGGYFTNLDKPKSNYELFCIVQDWIKTKFKPDEDGYVDKDSADWASEIKCRAYKDVHIALNKNLRCTVIKFCTVYDCKTCKQRYGQSSNFRNYEDNAIEINKLKDLELNCDYFFYYLGFVRVRIDEYDEFSLIFTTHREFEIDKNIQGANSRHIKRFLKDLGYFQTHRAVYKYRRLSFCLPFFLVNMNIIEEAIINDDEETFLKHNGKELGYRDHEIDKLIAEYDSINIYKQVLTGRYLKEGTECYRWYCYFE